MLRISYEQLEGIVTDVIAELPREFRRVADQTIIDVQDLPDDRMLKSLGLRDRYSLLGLYTGVPLLRKSVLHSGVLPDRIILFKTNLELASADADELHANIRKTLLHELGHAMGLTDAQLRQLGY